MDIFLLEFDIYQVKVAPNCFKRHTNSDVLIFFKKKFCLMSGLTYTMSDVT